MNEDEAAFIRTVQDNPRDLLPRLVYADWLSDRDDPRGEFLRTCCDILTLFHRLGELSSSIDGEWRDSVNPLVCRPKQGERTREPVGVIRMPDLGEGLGNAKVTKVLVRVGDRIAFGQDLIDVETDLAFVTIPTEHAGVVVAILVARGDLLSVGQPLLVDARC